MVLSVRNDCVCIVFWFLGYILHFTYLLLKKDTSLLYGCYLFISIICTYMYLQTKHSNESYNHYYFDKIQIGQSMVVEFFEFCKDHNDCMSDWCVSLTIASRIGSVIIHPE